MKRIIYITMIALVSSFGTLIGQYQGQTGGNGYYGNNGYGNGSGNQGYYGSGSGYYHNDDEPGGHFTGGSRSVKVALLLDTSGSMEGLINQAKSQLWEIVNELTWAFSDPYSTPVIEIALYEYGSGRLSYRDGYIRQIVPFTNNMDWISEELFSLRTSGSKEYCGAVINAAVEELRWGGGYHGGESVKLMYIAGNESFAQGPVDFRYALENAVKNNIQVNMIFCGGYEEGRAKLWEQAAYLGNGTYANILKEWRRPVASGGYFDKQLMQLNIQLNNTYIPFGRTGTAMKSRMHKQDENAQQMGMGIAAQRAITKGSGNYVNPDWDLIDAIDAGNVRLAQVPDAQLPTYMRGKPMKEKERILMQKKQERTQVKAKIAKIARSKHVESETAMKQQSAGKANMPQKQQSLKSAVVKSAKEKAQVDRKPTLQKGTQIQKGQTFQKGKTIHKNQQLSGSNGELRNPHAKPSPERAPTKKYVVPRTSPGF